MRHLLIIFYFFLGSGFVTAQESIAGTNESLVDISSELTYIFEKKIAQFSFDKSVFEGSVLLAESNEELYMFIDNKLVRKGSTVEINASLFQEGFKNRFAIIFYSEGEISNLRIYRVINQGESVSKQSQILLRTDTGFNDFVRFFIFLILGALTVFKVLLGKEVNEYFRFSYIFSNRNRDENIFKVKIGNPGHLLFLGILSMTAAFFAVLLTYVSGKVGGDFLDYLQEWLFYLMIWIVLFLLKAGIIRLMSFIYNTGRYYSLHLHNYFRITMIFMLLLNVIFLLSVWGNLFQLKLSTAFFLTLLFFIIRTLFLYLKLISEHRFKFFHLFSYLCGTEFIPLFVLIVLVQ